MKPFFITLLFLINAAFINAQVTINELMASNENTIVDNAGAHSDWVELYNSGGTALDLAGYYLTDDYANLKKFRFTTTPGQVVVPANGYLLIWASSSVASGVNHTSFSLSASGEKIALVLPDGQGIVDSLTFGPQRMDISYGRLPNGGSVFKYFTSSTPGAANTSANSYNELLSPPAFSHAGGFYSSPFTLTISHSDPGVTIYYTTDGSVPSAASLTPQSYSYRNNYQGSMQTKQYQSYTYTNALAVQDPSNLPNKISMIATTHSQSLSYLPATPIYKGKVIRAVAVKAGALTSEITSSSFFFSLSGINKFTLPVVSIMSQEDGLFDYYNGIYVAGIDSDTWRNANPSLTPDAASPANYHRSGEAAERPAHFEIIETDTVVYKQDVGLRINGASSASYRVKSLRLYGTDQYKTIEHPLFPQLPYDEYKTFILRNSGQDYNLTLFRDALIHESVAHLKIDIQAYRPSVLFLNGEYWGIHNMRQRQDKHYYAQKYGVNADSLDLIDTEIEEGSSTHYTAMLNYIFSNGVTNSTNYNYIKTQMDVENFRDYQIIEIFYNNQDWGTNNNRYWRRQTPYLPTAPYGLDGRWRWSLYDLDLSMAEASQDRLVPASEGTNNTFAPGFLLGRLLQNQTFRNDFINRFADLMNTAFLPNRITQLIEGKRDGISAEITAHISRWKTLTDSTAWLARIASCVSFVQQRPGYQRTHIRNKFGLSGQYNLTVNVSNPAHGYVRVNSIDILPTTPGVSASPYPWTGNYFYKNDNSISVVIRALPKLGYKFKHWVYNATILTDSVQTVTATSARSYTAVFEPALISATLEACGYVFREWASNATAGTFPANMKFVYMADTDPGVGSAVSGFTSGGYALTSGTRIRGQGANGFSIVNTGSGTVYPGTKLGGAVLVLNTQGKDSVTVSWIGRTWARGVQEYGVRLQYSIDKMEGFADVLDANNQVVEYNRGTVGSSAVLKVNLPGALLNQPYVYLLWRYYRKNGTSGNRDELGIDDIFVESKRILSGITAAGVSTAKEGTLISTAKVGSTSNVLYEAKRSVELRPGFGTNQSALFSAQINGCP